MRARVDAIDLLAPRLRGARRASSGSTARSLSYEGEPPTSDDLDGAHRRRSGAWRHGRGPHLHDVRIEAGGRDLRVVRLAGRAADRRALARPRRGRARCDARLDVPPLVLLDDVLSELDGDRRRALGAHARARLADRRHGDGGRRASRRARAGAFRHPGPGAVMERIGDEIERELGRGGSRDAIPLAALTAAWPDGGRRRGRPPRVAAQDRQGRNAPRRDGVVDLGTRARVPLGRDPRAPARAARDRRAHEAEVRGRPDPRGRPADEGSPEPLPAERRRAVRGAVRGSGRGLGDRPIRSSARSLRELLARAF